MANFTIADIKALREQLGTGMVDTKKALEEADGDVEKAVEILRLKGAKGNAKRADRSTSEGPRRRPREQRFRHACSSSPARPTSSPRTSASSLWPTRSSTQPPPPVPTRSRPPWPPTPTATRPSSSSSRTRPRSSQEGRAPSRAHHLGRQVRGLPAQDHKDLPPQVGVVLAYSGDDAETARSIAQHISFANPSYLTRDAVPEADVEKEREIVTEISRNEGKPEAALPKIVEGRVNASSSRSRCSTRTTRRTTSCPSPRVASDAGLTLTDFARFKVGA